MMPRCSTTRLSSRLVFILLATLLPSLISAPARAAEQSSRISYDSQCLTIDGRDTLIFSGSVHYVRCPKDLWRERFAEDQRRGRPNCIETYVCGMNTSGG